MWTLDISPHFTPLQNLSQRAIASHPLNPAHLLG
jgi:hypothetical protein